jgi:hypothetical protein
LKFKILVASTGPEERRLVAALDRDRRTLADPFHLTINESFTQDKFENIAKEVTWMKRTRATLC